MSYLTDGISLNKETIYHVAYMPFMMADEYRDNYIKYKIFEGILENFYSSGKCVFYNKDKNEYLVVQYREIIHFYPINNLKE